ncbi:MAG: hypothetical protein AAB783_00750 [Patescibacteria group bacterium]
MESIATLNPSDVLDTTAKFFRLLEREGVEWTHYRLPIDSKEARGNLAEYLKRGCPDLTADPVPVAMPTAIPPQWERARAIMGTNMFGLEEAIRHFGVRPSQQELEALVTIPFSEEVLTACRETHVLVVIFPFSILEIRSKVARKLFWKTDWYNNQAFAKEHGEVGWHLIRKTPIDNSTSKTWPEQQALLVETEETPKARVMVYTIIGHFLATGERLFERIYVRCVDLDSDGSRVYVGSFDAGGLYVDDIVWDGHRYGGIGVASARKSV